MTRETFAAIVIGVVVFCALVRIGRIVYADRQQREYEYRQQQRDEMIVRLAQHAPTWKDDRP